MMRPNQIVSYAILALIALTPSLVYAKRPAVDKDPLGRFSAVYSDARAHRVMYKYDPKDTTHRQPPVQVRYGVCDPSTDVPGQDIKCKDGPWMSMTDVASGKLKAADIGMYKPPEKCNELYAYSDPGEDVDSSTTAPVTTNDKTDTMQKCDVTDSFDEASAIIVNVVGYSDPQWPGNYTYYQPTPQQLENIKLECLIERLGQCSSDALYESAICSAFGFFPGWGAIAVVGCLGLVYWSEKVCESNAHMMCGG